MPVAAAPFEPLPRVAHDGAVSGTGATSAADPASPRPVPDSPDDATRGDDPARAPRRRRRWVPSSLRTVLGLVLVASGLGVLGWVGWQYYGTDFVARQAQQALVQRTEEAWEAQAAGDGPQAPLEVGAAEALIQIPRFGDDYVMPVQTGVGDDVLAEGFGHFEGAAAPGERGNYALAAHRVTHGEPLRKMPELRPGDEVVVTTRDAVHTYVMDTDPNDLVIGFENVWVVDPQPRNPDGGVGPASGEDRLITLTTCAELFHTDTRMIAFGHLVSSEPR
ncbi:class E sortase [Nocardioides sp. HDW12B]|nr:class E sortase [Nocardioides sp. HDW12B]